MAKKKKKSGTPKTRGTDSLKARKSMGGGQTQAVDLVRWHYVMDTDHSPQEIILRCFVPYSTSTYLRYWIIVILPAFLGGSLARKNAVDCNYLYET